jgi:cytochrome c-type biogenesis protein CcmH
MTALSSRAATPAGTAPRGRSRRRAVAWVCCLAVVAVALALGATHPSAKTPAQRAAAIDAVVRCPSCEGLSVADSSSATAVAIRAAVVARVHAGQSDAAIEQFLVSRYGEGILLRPPTSGLAGLVWLLPVVAAIAGITGIAVVFWRRRAPAEVVLSQSDRALVDAALVDAQSTGAGAPGEAGPT